jgi:hypothetical protein
MKDCSLWLAGEAMAELCREFGISRKTGYKLSGRASTSASVSSFGFFAACVGLSAEVPLLHQALLL